MGGVCTAAGEGRPPLTGGPPACVSGPTGDELKLNSYDPGVDIELYDAVDRAWRRGSLTAVAASAGV